jgi:ketosteroid isomerase-like protein
MIKDTVCMKTESNQRLLHEYHEAWECGDIARGIAFYAPDVIVHMGGSGALARDYRGRDDFVANWINRVSDYTDVWEVAGNEVLLAGEDGILLMVREVWEKDGYRVSTQRLGFYKVSNNLIVECWFSDMNQPEVEDFFAGIV